MPSSARGHRAGAADVAEPRHLQEANALRGCRSPPGRSSARRSPALLVAGIGPGGALVVDAGTFAVRVACLLALRPRVVERGDRRAVRSPTCKGGSREVRSRPWVWAFLVAMVVYHVVVLPAVFVLGPVLIEEELAARRLGGDRDRVRRSARSSAT